MLITAVIPTRNRPDDLERAVLSVCTQTRPPDELMVIDQSPGPESRVRIQAAVEPFSERLTVVYVHDAAIAGLVAAKKVAAERARGDVVCFLEDDIVLEPEYVAEMERAFIENPRMMGCCGVVVDMPELPRFYVLLHNLFHRGIFHDARLGVYANLAAAGHTLVPSDYLSGGSSAYRRQVFAVVPFDVHNQLFMLEDIDFSTRVIDAFGACLYINPRARLDHRMSPLNRSMLGARQTRKLREFLVFYKKRRARSGRVHHLALLLAGLFLEALFQAAQSRTVGPITGYFSGLRDGLRVRIKNPERVDDVK